MFRQILLCSLVSAAIFIDVSVGADYNEKEGIICGFTTDGHLVTDNLIKQSCMNCPAKDDPKKLLNCAEACGSYSDSLTIKTCLFEKSPGKPPATCRCGPKVDLTKKDKEIKKEKTK